MFVETIFQFLETEYKHIHTGGGGASSSGGGGASKDSSNDPLPSIPASLVLKLPTASAPNEKKMLTNSSFRSVLNW
jgi:hypothetical protein